MRIVLTGVVVFIAMVLTLFSPYKLIQDISADEIAEDAQLKIHFHSDPIRSADYKGSNTYIVFTASGNEFVVIKEYFTVMNFKWKIYKYKGGEEDE
jgi:hypothetical protein